MYKMLKAIGLLALLAGIPLLVQAQTLACNPTAPRLDPGSGFAPFGAAEQALARGGNSGPAWEWAVGIDTDNGEKVQGSLDWTSGKTYDWTLAYSGTGAATLEIRDAGALVLSLNYPSGMDSGNALELQVATNASIGSDTTIAATASSINGQAVTGSVSQTGNNAESAQAIYFYYPPMSQGFTAQGTVSLTYATLPTGSRVDFRARAGTLPCTNVAPTVSISAPADNSVVQAGSAVTVIADAQDADGTVSQVEFFANGVSIGTDTAAPYEIPWNAITPGPASLTARATDNAGDQTLSTAVSVAVNAQPTVSITSPAADAVFTAPATVSIAANAQDSDGTIDRVELYANATLIATLTVAPYTFDWTGVAAGGYTLSAKAFDNAGGEATSAGVPITVDTGIAVLHFIHTDHLNTPRLVADAAQQTVWRWDQAEPFGNNPADEDPDANSVVFDLPLRLPGQRYDAETALHYNYFRDYDPGIGRYAQSDPAGLVAGLHTFAYVSSQPLAAVDPFGLQANEPRDGLDPLVACKIIGRSPTPDICIDERKCRDQASKALIKCNSHWNWKTRIACTTCWRYISALCPGLDPGPECDRLACIRPTVPADSIPEV